MSKGILIVIVVAVLLMVALPVVGAQDVPGVSEPASDVIAPIDPSTILAAVEVLIATLLGATVTSFPTTFFTSLLKLIPAFQNVGAKWLAYGVAGLLSLVATIAAANGRTVQFNSVMELIQQIAYPVTLWIGTLLGSTALYNLAKSINAPIVGQERPGGGVSNRLRQELGQG